MSLILFVAGDPIIQSLSPRMHMAALMKAGLGEEYQYTALKVGRAELRDLLNKVRNGQYHGGNVTHPLKEEVIPLLDDLQEEAQLLGAVNTIFWEGDKLVGTNTDWLGFQQGMEEEGVRLQGKHCLVLGAGGAAKAVGYALLRSGAQLTIYNRTQARAEHVAKQLREAGEAEVLGEITSLGSYDTLVNCTTIGMDGQSVPLSPTLLHRDLVVIDIIYNPPITPLLNNAQQVGCKIVNGLGMFINQGAEAFKRFTGQEPDRTVMRTAVREGMRETN